MSFYTETFTAGESKRFSDVGRFFRLVAGTYPVDVRFYRAGAEIARADQIEAGYAEIFESPFDAIVIVSASAQTVKAVARNESNVKYDRSVGSVTLSDATRASLVSLGPVTIGTSATNPYSGSLSPSTRKGIILRNNGATVLWFRFNGTAAVAYNSLRLGPGEYWENNAFVVPSGVLSCISDAAGGSLVVAEYQ